MENNRHIIETDSLTKKIEYNFKTKINEALIKEDLNSVIDYTYKYSQFVIAELNMLNYKMAKNELKKLYIVKNKKKAEGDMGG
jgi:hypothetical protein